MPASVTLGAQKLVDYKGSLLAIPLGENPALTAALTELDTSIAGAIKRAIDARDFRGARDEVFQFSGPTNGARRIVLVGMGKVTDRAASLRRAAGVAARQAMKLGGTDLAFYVDDAATRNIESATVGIIAGSWEYKDLKTPPPEVELRKPVTSATILTGESDSSRRELESGIAIGAGYSLSRTLAMMPGNLCTPDFLASTAADIAKRHGMKITVLGRKEMEAEGMGSFLCVAQGTPQDPKLIAVEYAGGKPGDKPVTIVGKGLCFDSGGISIKPAQSMED
ncbi:MAG TPA: M17 family peptidase N-terminal domain-containing protein, partial [Gemmatimonadaceae bacterium]|nr:M17 family peptidase N-terminal domain-containing protein [Gemmatimonadaceae bacterium]